MDQAKLEQLSDLLSDLVAEMELNHPMRQVAVDLDYHVLDLLEQVEEALATE